MEGQSKTSKVDIDVHSDVSLNAFEVYYISEYENDVTFEGEYHVNESGFDIIGVHGSLIYIPFHGKGKFVLNVIKPWKLFMSVTTLLMNKTKSKFPMRLWTIVT